MGDADGEPPEIEEIVGSDRDRDPKTRTKCDPDRSTENRACSQGSKGEKLSICVDR